MDIEVGQVWTHDLRASFEVIGVDPIQIRYLGGAKWTDTRGTLTSKDLLNIQWRLSEGSVVMSIVKLYEE